jgi:hypothetical protein
MTKPKRKPKDPLADRPLKTIVHVNQHHIKSNLKSGLTEKPVLTARRGKKHMTGNVAVVRCRHSGRPLARFVYSPDKPLSCGARVWFETLEDVEVFTNAEELPKDTTLR